MSQAQSAKHRAAASSGAYSPDDLEAEMEATRLRLADTLDQLVYRVKPKTIINHKVAQTKARFVDAQGGVRREKVAAVTGAVVSAVAFLVVVRKLTKSKD